MCESNPKGDFPKDRLFLLEVYAGSQSPLTDAVEHLGLPCMRFTKEDGDLATKSGRAKLWSIVEMYQPEHIWVAPECGPWSGWNRLNHQKSSTLFDQNFQKQQDQMPHVRPTFSHGATTGFRAYQARGHERSFETCSSGFL